jgi:putative alpha-1,2-mannosidase
MADGNWQEWKGDARIQEWYGSIECDPYQQGWFVPHDFEGMVELMGGREKTLADLNNFFYMTPQNFMWNEYYNHANEPVHWVPFLFNKLQAPWMTQRWTRIICENAYHNAVEGIVGNEDVGQMSAWYILAASGLHPACAGDTRTEITSPVFDRITFKLDNNYFSGSEFTVVAHDNSPENVYIEKAALNGVALENCYIDFKDIAAGGKLELWMSSTPNESWGVN